MSLKTELSYAAGIIDGEGSICINKGTSVSSKYRYGYIYYLEVKVGMINAIIPMWLKENYGGSVRLYIKPKDRPQYVWAISSKKATGFLRIILPYLKLKQQQAQTAIQFQDLKKKPGTFNRYKKKPLAMMEAEGILRDKMRELNSTTGRGQR